MLSTYSLNVVDFLEKSINELNLTEERLKQLQNIGDALWEYIEKNDQVNLMFICTHNSIRSILSQVWAHYCSELFEIHNLRILSGGQTTSSVNRNVLTTLKNSGFKIEIEEFSHTNPKYAINCPGIEKPVICYSKLIESRSNPKPFIGILNCEEGAENNCPIYNDAVEIFNLTYKDPKNEEKHRFKEAFERSNRLIAGEIGVIFKRIKFKQDIY